MWRSQNKLRIYILKSILALIRTYRNNIGLYANNIIPVCESPIPIACGDNGMVLWGRLLFTYRHRKRLLLNMSLRRPL